MRVSSGTSRPVQAERNTDLPLPLPIEREHPDAFQTGGLQPLAAVAPSRLDPVLTQALKGTVRAGVQRLVALQKVESTGAFHSVADAGTLNALTPMLAFSLTGQLKPSDLALLEAMADRYQAKDGGFALYPGGPPSAASSRLFAAVVRLAERQGIASVRLTAASERAQAFAGPNRVYDTSLSDELSGLKEMMQGTAEQKLDTAVDMLEDLAFPEDERHSFSLIPPAELLTRVVGDGEKAEHALLSKMYLEGRRMLVALSMIATGAAHQQKEHRGFKGRALDKARSLVQRWGFKTTDAKELAKLEGYLSGAQSSNGSFSHASLTTAFAVLGYYASAVVRGEKDPQKATAQLPQVQQALAYLRSCETSLAIDGEARPHLNAWNADTWDTALLGIATLGEGGSSPENIQKAVQVVLSQQTEAGLWPYGYDSENSPDNDTTAAELLYLCHAWPQLQGEQQAAAQSAIERGVQALLKTQKEEDGSWGTAPESDSLISMAGRDTLGLLASVALDPGTADLTARVLAAVAFARKQGRVKGPEVDASLQRAISFMKDSLASNGLWWGRWSAGYVIATGFALAGLKAADADLHPFESVGERLLATQNPDGGWGETPAADEDPAQAARGPSMAPHTAFAVAGLAALYGPAHPRVTQGVEYLLKNQSTPGHWAQPPAFFTIVPSLFYGTCEEETDGLILRVLQAYQHWVDTGEALGFETLALPPRS